MTNLRRPVRLQNVFLTFRKPNNTLNGHVLITCERRFQKRQEDVLQTYRTSLVCHAGNVFDTLWVQTVVTRYQNVSVSGVASVFQTSGRRFAKVLDVSGLSRWTRVLHVVGRNVFYMLSERVRFRCCFRFRNVRKTFCKRFGRLRFVTLFR